MAEKKEAAKKTSLEMEPEEFEAKRLELSDAVKKAQKELWDFVHPKIEDPQAKALQEDWQAKQSERKAATAKAAKK
jgi:hypothetical protein